VGPPSHARRGVTTPSTAVDPMKSSTRRTLTLTPRRRPYASEIAGDHHYRGVRSGTSQTERNLSRFPEDRACRGWKAPMAWSGPLISKRHGSARRRPGYAT
jgi:hypothetical protein